MWAFASLEPFLLFRDFSVVRFGPCFFFDLAEVEGFAGGFLLGEETLRLLFCFAFGFDERNEPNRDCFNRFKMPIFFDSYFELLI